MVVGDICFTTYYVRLLHGEHRRLMACVVSDTFYIILVLSHNAFDATTITLMSSTKRGAFIVIEGLDRSGKSTQASLLYDRLYDVQDGGATPRVVLLKFPGTFPIHVCNANSALN